MSHRGPDDDGIYINQNSGFFVGIGNRRLSIVDLTKAGHQPMVNEANDIWLVYNGELYNNSELRKDLERRGHIYHSRTDTETILHAYEEYGLDCFRLFNGMFAIALYDTRRDIVILARDRMGIKPLYYWSDQRTTIFASELKTLLTNPDVPREVDPVALDLYLSLYYIPSPYCMLRNVRKLEPGHYAIIDRSGLRVQEFWRAQLGSALEPRLTPNQQIEQTRAVLEDAVRRQMVSDVPVGVLLSGGIDSTIIAGIAARQSSTPLETFAVGYTNISSESRDFNNDDLRYARQVSRQLGTNHHEIMLSDQELPALLPQLVTQLDEPFCESTSPAIYAVARLAHKHGVKVVLTGDGSDELFGGYAWYESARRLDRYERILGIRPALSILRRLPHSQHTDFKVHDLIAKIGQPSTQKYRLIYHLLTRAERQALLSQDLVQQLRGNAWERVLAPFIDQPAPLPDRLAFADLHLWVRELFNPRLDRIAMMCSVESRVPFQDNRVIDFALGLSTNEKIRSGTHKYLLKQAFRDVLPQEVLLRKKNAFVGPMNQWLRNGLREFALDTLSSERVAAYGLLDPTQVAQLTYKVLHDQNSQLIPVVWTLLVLQMWCELYLGRPQSVLMNEVSNA